jgi:hypothetical protein
MASPADFPARGKVIRVEGDHIVFAPVNTNYEMHLKGSYDGPLGVPVLLLIRAEGRKLMTVPSGGNFVAPIFGTPKTFQGRVRYADESQVVIHAGVPVVVKLPAAEDALDLANGSVTVGQMLNAIVLAGASFEVVKSPAMA